MQFKIITLLLFFISLSSQAQENNFEFSDKDLLSFWKAFDEFKKDTTQNPFSGYIKDGSPLLKHYHGWYVQDDTLAWKNFIQSNLAYYDNVRSSTLLWEKQKDSIAVIMDKFIEIYPQARRPKIYLLIGVVRPACSWNEEGVGVSMEMFADSAYQTKKGFKAIRLEKLSKAIVTCLIEYNNRPAPTGYNLLRESVVRGSVNFISSLLSSDLKNIILNNPYHVYGEAHEADLVLEFIKRKDQMNLDGWFYCSDQYKERPYNLGYWIGYKITEGYYYSFQDKQKAIDAILKINDFDKFLEISGYTASFESR